MPPAKLHLSEKKQSLTQQREVAYSGIYWMVEGKGGYVTLLLLLRMLLQQLKVLPPCLSVCLSISLACLGGFDV